MNKHTIKRKLSHLELSLCLSFVFWLFPSQLIASEVVLAEYKLKAALLYKLAKFVEWPEQSRHSFTICLLGRDDFGVALEALNERKIAGNQVKVQRYKQSSAIENSCQLLFISDSKKVFLESIFNTLQQQPILTIGDTDKFAQRGGMIQFTKGHKRIGFKINIESANAAGLSIAAPLLDLSTIVKSNRKEEIK